MGRRKKPGFTNVKMLSARCELGDYYRFEDLITKHGKKRTVQEVLNSFIVSYISGTIKPSGSLFVGGDDV